MGFSEEGNWECQVLQAIVAKAKFCEEPNAFDVCFEVQNLKGEKDWVTLEYSQRYGVGNASDKMQWQMTVERLTSLGVPNGDVSQIGTLVGKVVSCYSKKNNSGYMNVRFGGSNAPETIDPAEAMRRAQAIMSGAGGGGFAQPQQPATGGFQQPATGGFAQPAQGGFPQQTEAKPF